MIVRGHRTFFSHVPSRELPGLVDQIKDLVDKGDISPGDGIVLGGEMLRRLKLGRFSNESHSHQQIKKVHSAMVDMAKQRPGMSKEQASALRHDALMFLKSTRPQTLSSQCTPNDVQVPTAPPYDRDEIEYARKMAEFLSGPKPSDFGLQSAFHDADLNRKGGFRVPNVETLRSRPTRPKDK